MHIINFKKKLTVFFLAASAVCTLYAQQELSLLQPEKTTDILQKETEFIIRTDKKKCQNLHKRQFYGTFSAYNYRTHSRRIPSFNPKRKQDKNVSLGRNITLLCQMKRSRQSRQRLYIYQSHMSRLRHLLPVRYFGKRPHIYKLVHQNPAEIRRLLHSAKHIVHTFLGCAFKI